MSRADIDLMLDASTDLLLVVSAENSAVHNLPAASMLPVSSHSSVPVCRSRIQNASDAAAIRSLSRSIPFFTNSRTVAT